MKEAGVSTDFKIAAELFQALGTYSDAAELRVQCLNRMKKCEQREFRLGRAILIGIAIVIVTVIAVPIVRKQILSARESRAYQEAMKLYEQGDYAAASSAFAALDDYKDSDKMEIYANAISLYEDGSYSAVINFLDVRNLGFVDQVTQELSGMAALHMSDVGDKVVFGGGRTWTVLERQGNQLLLYARGTENLPFDEQGSANDWENCSLRETLNASYYADNFNQREQKVILETDTSDTTKDKIFVLSAEEADRYQTPLNSRYDGLTTRFRNMERALTRTVENGEVVCISLGSYFEYTTCDIDRSYDVHPAMWIDLDLYEW